jgi:hypothetical protein
MSAKDVPSFPTTPFAGRNHGFSNVVAPLTSMFSKLRPSLVAAKKRTLASGFRLYRYACAYTWFLKVPSVSSTVR